MICELRIAVVGLDEMAMTILKVSTTLLSAYEIEAKVTPVEEAQVLLIEASFYASRSQHYADDQEIICVGSNTIQQGHRCLPYPLRAVSLAEELSQICRLREERAKKDQSFMSTLVGIAKPIMTDKEAREDGAVGSNVVVKGSQGYCAPFVSLDNIDSFFGALTYAVCTGHDVLVGGNGRFAVLCGTMKKAYLQFDVTYLAEFAGVTGESLLVSDLNRRDKERFLLEGKRFEFSELIWLAAYFGGKGRLYDQLGLIRPFKLVGFPKFPRRYSRPEFMRLAALLSRKALSISLAAKKAQCSESLTIDFYNLMLCLDLVAIAEQEVPPKGFPKTERKGLIERLVKKFSAPSANLKGT